MGIRLKVLLAFILCFGLMAGVSLMLLQRSVNESYNAIERGDIVASMGRVEQSFEASAASLKTQASDWAVWNEMYRYALNPDPDWEKENIDESTLMPGNLNMVMVFDKRGHLLSASSVNPDGDALDISLVRMKPYLDHILKDAQQTACGIIKIDTRLMLTCWAGIVPSTGVGDVAGTIIMGRLLDPARIAKLREQTRLLFELETKTGRPAGLSLWPDIFKPGAIGSGEFWTANDEDEYHLYFSVQDILKQDVGLITLDVPRAVHKQGLALYHQVREQLAWAALVMTILLGLVLDFILIRRLRRFAKQIDVLETQSSWWDERIDIGGRDELGVVATNFNELLALIKSQMEGLRELLSAKEEAIEVIQATQAQLIESEKKALHGQQRVSDLLNNSGEGFLSFGADLLIAPEISLACESMLGSSPVGRNAALVFGGADTAKVDLFGKIISAVLAASDSVVRDSMLSLLPTEISRGERLLKAEYKFLEDSRFMVVLTDITEERRLEAMLQDERRRLELIVCAVSDSRNLFDAIEAFRAFISHDLPCMFYQIPAPQSLVEALFREIHTFKGLLNQFSFIHTPKALHALETRLSRLQSFGDTLTLQNIAEIISQAALLSPFDADLAVLSEALGKAFLENGECITLSVEQAAQLEKLAQGLLSGEPIDASAQEINSLLNELLTLRKLSFQAVLIDFDGLVQQVAKRLEKAVAPLEVIGGADLWIYPQPYQPFLRSLAHVFRNAVAHGLETPEDRWAADKDEIGKISCHVAQQGNIIQLRIEDDGAGIDLATLRQRAVSAGIYAADEVQAVPEDEIIRLIFRDNMSTRDRVTDLSGRGVGLAAVLSETQALGGKVEVRTTAGQGTQFVFSLPLLQAGQNDAASPTLNDEVAQVMQAVVAQTCRYFENEHQLSVADSCADSGELAALTALDMTVVVSMSGRFKLLFAFSFEESLVNAVHAWMTAGFDDRPVVLEKYRQAAIGEVVNTIMGNSTEAIQHLDRDGISLTPPVILGRGAAIEKSISCGADAMFFTRGLNTMKGRLNISLVGPEEIISTFAQLPNN